MAESIIATKAYAFAIRVVRMYQYLAREQREFVLSKQLVRSGTSIGANTEEAVAAQSKADFVHKLQVALKEARETSYWLRLLHDTNYIETNGFQSIHQDCQELIRILNSIILTSQKKGSIAPTHNS